MNLNDGKEHIIMFSKGKLFIDDIQVAGEGIFPDKNIVFKFNTNTVINNDTPIRDAEIIEEFSPVLSVNVHDSVLGKAIGPGQL